MRLSHSQSAKSFGPIKQSESKCDIMPITHCTSAHPISDVGVHIVDDFMSDFTVDTGSETGSYMDSLDVDE